MAGRLAAIEVQGPMDGMRQPTSRTTERHAIIRQNNYDARARATSSDGVHRAGGVYLCPAGLGSNGVTCENVAIR